MLLNTYEDLNGTVTSMLTRDDLIALTVDSQILNVVGDNNEKVEIIPRSTHEIHADYRTDNTGRTSMHLVDASLKINGLKTSGIVVFRKWNETHYVVTVKYYPFPDFGE